MNVSEATQRKMISTHAKVGTRAGATNNLESRNRDYVRDDGYSTECTMYYRKTQNMKMAENKLLKLCPCPNNVQRMSNMPPKKPGFVYLIVEPKSSCKKGALTVDNYREY